MNRVLKNIQLSDRAIICEDFNAHYSWWNSKINNLVCAESLITWLE